MGNGGVGEFLVGFFYCLVLGDFFRFKLVFIFVLVLGVIELVCFFFFRVSFVIIFLKVL